MNLKGLILSHVVAASILSAGCVSNYTETAEGAPLARQITASDQCGVVAPGLIYLTEKEDLGRLQDLPMQNLSMKPLNALDFDREHVLIVGLGQKPTGGYGLTLANSQIESDTLKLTMILRRPAPDAMVTQVLTTPCAVLAITPERWKSIEVKGNGFNTLELDRSFNR
ncbi:protease complex subunit PrcB family protein [Marinobacter halotolerans]|uniref:protease complex subunit PrcB family protein n=1 Tax=Marinobacter halotolerans TaxID=1569211 RepID=UPI001245E65A|nr:protease complex subunit PrcB family protein [Marinobacter halotolerans]